MSNSGANTISFQSDIKVKGKRLYMPRTVNRTIIKRHNSHNNNNVNMHIDDRWCSVNSCAHRNKEGTVRNQYYNWELSARCSQRATNWCPCQFRWILIGFQWFYCSDIVRLRRCLHSGCHDLENNPFKVIVTVLILGLNIGVSIFGSTHPLISI